MVMVTMIVVTVAVCDDDDGYVVDGDDGDGDNDVVDDGDNDVLDDGEGDNARPAGLSPPSVV